MKLKRSDIKHNFLRRIIFRIDYNGVVDIKPILSKVESSFPNHGFVKMKEGRINDYEFKLSDPELIESQRHLSVKNIQELESFKYSNEDETMILDINKLYMSLEIITKEYKDFQKYNHIFSTLVSDLRTAHIFLLPTRLGVRKINTCLVKEIVDFEEYFNSKYFSNITKEMNLQGLQSNRVNTDLLDTFELNNFFFNYQRVATSASMFFDDTNEEIEVVQVTVDVDGYTHNQLNLQEMLVGKEVLETHILKLNGYLFEIYVQTLSDKLQAELTKEKFTDENIIGVAKNGV